MKFVEMNDRVMGAAEPWLPVVNLLLGVMIGALIFGR
jgi:hypothetical protein